MQGNSLAISDLAGTGASTPSAADLAGAPNRSGGRRVARRLGTLYRAIDIYILFILCFVLYWLLGDFFGFEGERYIFQLEFPVAIYGFYALNRILRPSRFRPLVAALPIFGAYIAHDLHWFFFNDILGFIQVKELPELFTVGGFGLRAVIIGLGAALIVFFIRLQYNLRTLVLSAPYFVLIWAMLFHPAAVMVGIEESVGWVSPWLPQDNAARNGRFVTALFNEAKRRVAKGKLEGYGVDPGQEGQYAEMMSFLKEKAKGERQVFFVVLESFLDPRHFKSLKEKNEYVDERFRKPYDRYMGFSISPVFAGGTAQAEFELLCGAPAFAEFERTEFNLFSGAPIPCLPEVLGELGYDTVANYPYIPSFFNAQRAYEGLGFREAYFAREHTDQPTYLHLEEKGKYLFDGLLYDQNRAFLAQRQGNKKIFNYVLTLYGHLYYEVQRPLAFDVPVKDDFLKRIANITYYRTGPLADYLQWLSKEYPQSLIVVVGDHLPGLTAGADSYNAMQYLDNRPDSIHHSPLLVIENGKPKKLPTIQHFGVPYLVYDYLTDGAFCKQFDCPTKYPYSREKLKDRYRYLVAQANRDRDRPVREEKGTMLAQGAAAAPLAAAGPAQGPDAKGGAGALEPHLPKPPAGETRSVLMR